MDERSSKTCILACETLKPELEFTMDALGMALPAFWVESGKHVFPDQLRASIQGNLDGIPAEYDTVLLLFGFCGNAMVGVNTGSRRVVLPKVADCIPIFLGSREERNKYGTRRYFFTEGYFNAESNPSTEYGRIAEKYGEENARMITREMLKHYEYLSVVDTGAFDVDAITTTLADLSEMTSVPVDVLPGDLRLIKMLLTGDWPEDEFFVFESGSEITLRDSMSFQSVSQIG
jgi:hypothetical protein